jgi:hypothetical protein
MVLQVLPHLPQQGNVVLHVANTEIAVATQDASYIAADMIVINVPTSMPSWFIAAADRATASLNG